MFPAVGRTEKAKEYIERCMNKKEVVLAFPNRRERKLALREYFLSLDNKWRHGHIRPDKYLYPMDAAKFLGINYGLMNTWRKKGILVPKYIKLQGYKRKVAIYDIETLEKVRNEIIAAKQKADSD